ncbi:hypothetical protein Ocin01_16744 [Orchesella cincta]|uniref:Uncharacterized protein n=1 Tax=Orchesella cincta TaxID=48709 RepID=A0A1D2MAI1_ORCCI|nr:hypothetical protein Ocin01_16744 [Orchesella cincta]
MAFNPCPCVPIEGSVKGFAFFDGHFKKQVVGILRIIWGTTLLVFVSLEPADHPHLHHLKVAAIVILSFFLVFTLSEIGLAVLLFSGVKNRSSSKCSLWLVVTGIIVGFSILTAISRQLVNGDTELVLLGMVIWILFKIYESLVVYAFIQGVNGGNKGSGVVYPNSDTRLLEPSNPQPPPQ